MHSRLVEQVARAICKAMSFDPDERDEGTPGWADFVQEAKAALVACYAEEMLEALRKCARRLSYQRNVGLSHQGDGELISELVALLAKLEGRI
jgi:hypothetical protein